MHCTTVTPVIPPDYQGAMNTWSPHVVSSLELHIAFLNGDKADREFVMKTANEWVEHVNLSHARMQDVLKVYRSLGKHRLWLRFAWDNVDPNTQSDPAKAQIRIDLQATESWSYIGTDAVTSVLSPAPTMCLSLLKDPNHPAWGYAWRRNHVLHEFGHALGLVHEHQLPLCNKLKENEVIGHFRAKHTDAQQQAKAEKYARENILPVYGHKQLSYAKGPNPDTDSIMIYPLHRDWLQDPSKAKVRIAFLKILLFVLMFQSCRFCRSSTGWVAGLRVNCRQATWRGFSGRTATGCPATDE